MEESDESVEISDEVSIAIQDYLDEGYEEVEADGSKNEEFYYMLQSIGNIGVDDYDLDDKVQYYKELIEESDIYEEEDSYEDDSYAEDTTSDNPYTETDIDYDCSDFDTQEDAQLFYEANGGPDEDPHDLDRDYDGMACDWNDEEYAEGEEYYEEENSDNPYSATDIDHDCSDFETGYDAQLFYEANGGPEYDPHDLDRDNDGLACDWNP